MTKKEKAKILKMARECRISRNDFYTDDTIKNIEKLCIRVYELGFCDAYDILSTKRLEKV